MLQLDKVIKPWNESAALNDHINLYGFWNETTFLTKSGDLGMVLHLQGVDYETHITQAVDEYKSAYLVATRQLSTRRIGARALIPIEEVRKYARFDHPERLAG